MANISKTEIKNEAKKIIDDIFIGLFKTDDKIVWLKAFKMIDNKIMLLEHGERGLQLFAWVKVKQILNSKYGEKFVKPNLQGKTPNIIIID